MHLLVEHLDAHGLVLRASLVDFEGEEPQIVSVAAWVAIIRIRQVAVESESSPMRYLGMEVR